MIADYMNLVHIHLTYRTVLFVVFFLHFLCINYINAKDISENLKRQGGFYSGVRPGAKYSRVLNTVASRLILSTQELFIWD